MGVEISKKTAQQKDGHEQVVHRGQPGDVLYVNWMESEKKRSHERNPAIVAQPLDKNEDKIRCQNMAEQHCEVPSRRIRTKDRIIQTKP